MKALIVAGGEAPGDGLMRRTAEDADLVIAADAGLKACLQSGVIPDFLVGDLDSAPADVLRMAADLCVPIQELPAEKDETDLERAAWTALGKGADEVAILGAGGGRPDHFLGNLAVLLWCAEHGARAFMEDDACSIYASVGFLSLEVRTGMTLSIIPAQREAVVTADGLYYPLDSLLLRNDAARGVSNVTTAKRVTIRSNGSVFAVLNKKL